MGSFIPPGHFGIPVDPSDPNFQYPIGSSNPVQQNQSSLQQIQGQQQSPSANSVVSNTSDPPQHPSPAVPGGPNQPSFNHVPFYSMPQPSTYPETPTFPAPSPIQSTQFHPIYQPSDSSINPSIVDPQSFNSVFSVTPQPSQPNPNQPLVYQDSIQQEVVHPYAYHFQPPSDQKPSMVGYQEIPVYHQKQHSYNSTPVNSSTFQLMPSVQHSRSTGVSPIPTGLEVLESHQLKHHDKHMRIKPHVEHAEVSKKSHSSFFSHHNSISNLAGISPSNSAPSLSAQPPSSSSSSSVRTSPNYPCPEDWAPLPVEYYANVPDFYPPIPPQNPKINPSVLTKGSGATTRLDGADLEFYLESLTIYPRLLYEISTEHGANLFSRKLSWSLFERSGKVYHELLSGRRLRNTFLHRISRYENREKLKKEAASAKKGAKGEKGSGYRTYSPKVDRLLGQILQLQNHLRECKIKYYEQKHKAESNRKLKRDPGAGSTIKVEKQESQKNQSQNQAQDQRPTQAQNQAQGQNQNQPSSQKINQSQSQSISNNQSQAQSSPLSEFPFSNNIAQNQNVYFNSDNTNFNTNNNDNTNDNDNDDTNTNINDNVTTIPNIQSESQIEPFAVIDSPLGSKDLRYRAAPASISEATSCLTLTTDNQDFRDSPMPQEVEEKNSSNTDEGNNLSTLENILVDINPAAHSMAFQTPSFQPSQLPQQSPMRAVPSPMPSQMPEPRPKQIASPEKPSQASPSQNNQPNDPYYECSHPHLHHYPSDPGYYSKVMKDMESEIQKAIEDGIRRVKQLEISEARQREASYNQRFNGVSQKLVSIEKTVDELKGIVQALCRNDQKDVSSISQAQGNGTSFNNNNNNHNNSNNINNNDNNDNNSKKPLDLFDESYLQSGNRDFNEFYYEDTPKQIRPETDESPIGSATIDDDEIDRLLRKEKERQERKEMQKRAQDAVSKLEKELLHEKQDLEKSFVEAQSPCSQQQQQRLPSIQERQRQQLNLPPNNCPVLSSSSSSSSLGQQYTSGTNNGQAPASEASPSSPGKKKLPTIQHRLSSKSLRHSPSVTRRSSVSSIPAKSPGQPGQPGIQLTPTTSNSINPLSVTTSDVSESLRRSKNTLIAPATENNRNGNQETCDPSAKSRHSSNFGLNFLHGFSGDDDGLVHEIEGSEDDEDGDPDISECV